MATGALRVLLTGAAGLVGQGVALACQRSPRVADLTALVRHPGSLNGRGSELIVPDFLGIEERQDDLSGFDACFYCAGAPPLGTAETEYRRVTLDTTLAVAGHGGVCRHQPDRRWRARSGGLTPVCSPGVASGNSAA